MENYNPEKIRELLRLRAEGARRWLEKNKGKRQVFSYGEVAQIAKRTHELLEACKKGDRTRGIEPVPRGSIAAKVFGGTPEEALSKLRYYAAPRRPKRSGKVSLSRTPGPYGKLVEAIAEKLNRNIDELLVEVFEGTQADPFVHGQSSFEHETARDFDDMLRKLAQRVSRRLDLPRYYRDLAMYGAIRNLEAREVRFRRDIEPEAVSPTADFPSALIPVVDAVGREYDEFPFVFQGRLPAIPLYRVRISKPLAVDLRLRREGDPGTGVTAIECRRGWVSDYWELRLGVGPRNNSAESALFFEGAWMCLITQSEVPWTAFGEKPADPLQPAPAHELPGLLGWPDEEMIFYCGNQVLRGSAFDPETGGPFEGRTVEELKDIEVGVDPNAVEYYSATPEMCRQFLVDWPYRYLDRIHYLGLRPSGGKRPTGGFMPPTTPGEALEAQLLDGDGSIEVDLVAAGQALREAFDSLREEHRAAVAATGNGAAETEGPAVPAERVAKCLEMSVRDWRRDLGLTQEQAARLLGITLRTFGSYERGTHTIPHTVRLAMLYCAQEPELAKGLAAGLETDTGARGERREALGI